MLKNISFVNENLRITETSFLRLKSSSRLHSSTFGNYSFIYICLSKEKPLPLT